MVFSPHRPVQRPVHEIGVAVIIDGDEVLVTRRAPSQHLPGLDEFPGGHREARETLEDCVLREVREETGLRVRPIGLLASKQHAYEDRTVWLWFFHCELVGPRTEPDLLRERKGRWIPKKNLTSLKFPDGNERVVAMLARNGVHS